MRPLGSSFVAMLLVGLGALAPLPASARNPPKSVAEQRNILPRLLCRPAIVSAEIGGRLPARLLEAIALVESGRLDKPSGQRSPWPWTINADGEGYFFDTKAQAIAAVKALQARGVQSIDVGCMQVNLMHHPNAFANLDQAFDPQANARYAARFLNELYARTPSWPQATAYYHSQTPQLGADYQRRVMAVWERPSRSPSAPIYATAFAAFPRSGYVDILQGGQHYQAFVPADQKFAAFGRGR